MNNENSESAIEKHYHVAKYIDDKLSDECATCGKDLRDDVHMTYSHKGPEHPEEWWKSSEYIGVETWDVPKIVAESRRRTLVEVREMVMAEWKEDRNAHSVELLNNVLNKLDEMK